MRTAAGKRQCCGSTAQPGAGAPLDSCRSARFLPRRDPAPRGGRIARGRRITCRAMPRPAAVACLAALAALSGCGERKIEVAKGDKAVERGAILFSERCSGCHTLEAANARGSAQEGVVGKNERTDGPNFNIRKENRDDVLFAIRNGGF